LYGREVIIYLLVRGKRKLGLISACSGEFYKPGAAYFDKGKLREHKKGI
jgi:hypothetical protein